MFRNASHFRKVRSHIDTRRASNDLGISRDVLMTIYFFFDFDENVGKCEIYLCLSRNGLPNRENLLMCEHLKTCAKEPISFTFFLDDRSHTLRVSAHLTQWKWRRLNLDILGVTHKKYFRKRISRNDFTAI